MSAEPVPVDIDAAVQRITASIHFDRALARYDLRLSAAHARMLRAQGLITPADEQALLKAKIGEKTVLVSSPVNNKEFGLG